MSKLIRCATLLAAMAIASGAHASVMYDYSYTFASGDVMSGTFNGDASGNLVTNLTGITASFNGTPLAGSGALFNATLVVPMGRWVADGGVASFDGTQNDFLFVDSHYPIDSNYTNYFYSINDVGTLANTQGGRIDEVVVPGFWSLAVVPEPGTGALLLAGLGLMSLALRRKRAQL